MNSTQTLMIDLMPDQGSSITACVSSTLFELSYASSLTIYVGQNNLVRCSLSAALVSVIQLIIEGIGVGWTYVLLGGLLLLVLPLLYLEIRIGPKCREKRRLSK
jgi:hypothetical protein